MIADVTRKMENVLGAGPLSVAGELAEQIGRAEVEAFLTGAFAGRETEQYFAVRDFYERLAVLLVEARDFEALPQKFALLARLYQQPAGQARPSLYEAKLTSLHLLYLFTGGAHEEFYTKLAALPSLVLRSAEVTAVGEFAQLVELGNYQRAFDLVQTLSPSHQVLLVRLVDQRRYQTCKMLEHSHPGLQVADLARLLELKNEEDFTRAIALIDELYAQGEINWRVVERYRIERREKTAAAFSDEKAIRDAIGLIREFEKII